MKPLQPFQVNFSDEALRENVGAFVNALLLAKPVGLKKSKLAIFLILPKFGLILSDFVKANFTNAKMLFCLASKYAGYMNSFTLCSTVSFL